MKPRAVKTCHKQTPAQRGGGKEKEENERKKESKKVNREAENIRI